MSKSSKASSTYLRFLNLVQAVRALPSFPSMDPVEEKLLNLFAVAWHSGKPLTVVEAMGMAQDVSPATVHRRISTLREKGLITFDIDIKDNRVKYIVGTAATQAYFTDLGKCLDQAQSK